MIYNKGMVEEKREEPEKVEAKVETSV